MIVYEDIVQGSDDWDQIRLGRATASQASNILTPGGKLSKSRIKYARKLARECFQSDPMEFAGNKFTDWGNDHEAEARAKFEEMTGHSVKEVGFCTRVNGIIGCSPDGLIANIGGWLKGLEIKCPQVDKHVEYYLAGELPAEYKLQVHWSLATTGLNSWFFMSYFPGAKPFIIEVMADEFTEKVRQAQDDFIIDYHEVYDEVKAVFPKASEGKEDA